MIFMNTNFTFHCRINFNEVWDLWFLLEFSLKSISVRDYRKNFEQMLHRKKKREHYISYQKNPTLSEYIESIVKKLKMNQFFYVLQIFIV